MKPCRCEPPSLPGGPRHPFTCSRCGFTLDPDSDYAASDRTHNAFLDRLELAMREAEGWPRNKPPPPEWQHFRRLVLAREQAGRPRFGVLGHLAKDNEAEAADEAFDLANYFYFCVMQAVRERGEHSDLSLVLSGCWFAYRAYLVTQELQAKRGGAP